MWRGRPARVLLLRLMVGLLFATSGYSHLKTGSTRQEHRDAEKHNIFLGITEVAGALGVAAFGLILIMVGAIQKKFLPGTQAFAIAFTNGGAYVLMK